MTSLYRFALRCRPAPTAVCALALIAALGSSRAALAQGFGRNKVQYENFDWRVLSTPHFEVFFYDEQLAGRAAIIAEDAYLRLSKTFHHQLSAQIPFILYASPNDFQQTNISDELIGESTGGFSEPTRNRMVLPYPGDNGQFIHVINHELVHVFMFDIAYHSTASGAARRALFPIPLWFAEGAAEWFSAGWDKQAEMWVRDATVYDWLAPLYLINGGFQVYKEGQSAMRYMARTYGDEKVVELFKAVGRTRELDRALELTIGLNEQTFSQRWEKSLKQEYWPLYAHKQEEETAAHRLTDHEKERAYFNQQPSLSPDGRSLAFFSDRKGLVDLFLMNAADGTIVRKLITGYKSNRFLSLHSFESSIGFSPSGDRICFIARSGAHEVLYVVRTKDGKVLTGINLKMEIARSPSWSPKADLVVFSGTKAGRTDLYVVDLATKQVEQLTDDVADEAAPSWYPSGDRVIYSAYPGNMAATRFSKDEKGKLRLEPVDFGSDKNISHVGQSFDLWSVELLARKPELVFASSGDDTDPIVADDSTMVFVSDASGISNLYIQNLRTRRTHRFSDVLGGIFQPTISPSADRLVCTGFNKGGFDLFLLENFRAYAAEHQYTEPIDPRILVELSAPASQDSSQRAHALLTPAPSAGLASDSTRVALAVAAPHAFAGTDGHDVGDSSAATAAVSKADSTASAGVGLFGSGGSPASSSEAGPSGTDVSPSTDGSAAGAAGADLVAGFGLVASADSTAGAHPEPGGGSIAIADSTGGAHPEPSSSSVAIADSTASAHPEPSSSNVASADSTASPATAGSTDGTTGIAIVGTASNDAHPTGAEAAIAAQSDSTSAPATGTAGTLPAAGAETTPVAASDSTHTPVPAAQPAAPEHGATSAPGTAVAATAPPPAAPSSPASPPRPDATGEVAENSARRPPDDFGADPGALDGDPQRAGGKSGAGGHRPPGEQPAEPTGPPPVRRPVGTVEPYRARFSLDPMGGNGVGGIYYSSSVGLAVANQISFSDLLGNQRLQFLVNFYGSLKDSDLSASYYYLKRRINYGFGVFHYKNYINSSFTSLGEVFDGSRMFTERNYGVFGVASLPFSQFERVDFELQWYQSNREFFQVDSFGFVQQVDRSIAQLVQPSLSYVHDTAFYGPHGPVMGNRWLVSLAPSVPVNDSSVRRTTGMMEYRRYFNAWYRNSFAFRIVMASSTGSDPRRFTVGGPSTLRGYDVYDFERTYPGTNVPVFKNLVGRNLALMNLEYRFPAVDYLIFGWPGRFGFSEIGCTTFFDLGSAFDKPWSEFQLVTNDDRVTRLADLNADFGFGIRANVGWLPLRFDWGWKTDFAQTGKPQFSFSIGPEF